MGQSLLPVDAMYMQLLPYYWQLRSSVKVEVAILGCLSRTVLMVSVDIRQHWTELLLTEVCFSFCIHYFLFCFWKYSWIDIYVGGDANPEYSRMGALSDGGTKPFISQSSARSQEMGWAPQYIMSNSAADFSVFVQSDQRSSFWRDCKVITDIV